MIKSLIIMLFLLLSNCSWYLIYNDQNGIWLTGGPPASKISDPSMKDYDISIIKKDGTKWIPPDTLPYSISIIRAKNGFYYKSNKPVSDSVFEKPYYNYFLNDHPEILIYRSEYMNPITDYAFEIEDTSIVSISRDSEKNPLLVYIIKFNVKKDGKTKLYVHEKKGNYKSFVDIEVRNGAVLQTPFPKSNYYSKKAPFLPFKKAFYWLVYR